MAVDTVHKKRAGLTAGLPFYASSTSLGSPISMSDKWEGAWTYPIGQYDLTLDVSDNIVCIDIIEFIIDFVRSYLDTFDISDGTIFDLGEFLVLAFSDSFSVTDIIQLVIPSWLRRLRVEDVEHYIIIKRIR